MKYRSAVPLFQAFTLGRPDRWGTLFYTMLGFVALWPLLVLTVRPIAREQMRRMHLANNSFPAFALEQLVPAMYNFSNQGYWSKIDVPLADWPWELPRDREVYYFNHFPVRNLTWQARAPFPAAGVWGLYRTQFQGLELRTKYHLQPAAGGGWCVMLTASSFTDAQP